MKVWIRGIAFVALAAFIVLGPFDRQVLGGQSELFRAWRMFRGNSIDMCDVRYFQQVDGQRTPIDRFAVLGYPVWHEAPQWLREIRKKQGVENVGHRLCTALGPGADVRAEARCAAQSGWVPTVKPDRDLCRP